jgi:hypothetical protein
MLDGTSASSQSCSTVGGEILSRPSVVGGKDLTQLQSAASTDEFPGTAGAAASVSQQVFL